MNIKAELDKRYGIICEAYRNETDIGKQTYLLGVINGICWYDEMLKGECNATRITNEVIDPTLRATKPQPEEVKQGMILNANGNIIQAEEVDTNEC